MATITDPIRQRTGPSPEALAQRYARIRALSEALAAPLSDADATAQSMPDASPAKWHLAHVSWFFETFVLRDHVRGYRLFDDRWPYLFNSYYEAEGPRHARPQRGLLTRPSLEEVLAYRAVVDGTMLDAMPMLAERCRDLIELGLNHEQQHQELLLTDLKHLFACNPLGPAVWPAGPEAHARVDEPPAVRWREGPSGLVEIGDRDEGFAFDNERPVHKAHLSPFALADRLVTNGEWLCFIADGGYAAARLWLSDGWVWVQRDEVECPLYWRQAGNGWEQFSLSGWQPLDLAAPVTHISFYEADAFAGWAGARLPTEQEWEAAAGLEDPSGGVQLDEAGPVAPRSEAREVAAPMFGNVWQWTGSAYRPYPGFRAAPGAVGEYNGKFMSGQFVLKGGSCATPRGHVRATYRNFFYPQQRWQFTGLRLARDL
nr:ergothioneine biosynthesis protein EgtB [Sphingomonas sp. Y57]